MRYPLRWASYSPCRYIVGNRIQTRLSLPLSLTDCYWGGIPNSGTSHLSPSSHPGELVPTHHSREANAPSPQSRSRRTPASIQLNFERAAAARTHRIIRRFFSFVPCMHVCGVGAHCSKVWIWTCNSNTDHDSIFGPQERSSNMGLAVPMEKTYHRSVLFYSMPCLPSYL